MTNLRHLAAACALSLTVFGLGVPAASAGEREQIRTKRGYVWFSDKGEFLGSLDQRRDGVGVQARLTWYTNGGAQVSVTDGSSAAPAQTLDLSLAEGTVVVLQMCYTDHSVILKCSDAQRAIA